MKKARMIRVKNDVPHLLEAVCCHPDCPDWIEDAIWNAFNNQVENTPLTATYWTAQMEAIEHSSKPDVGDKLPSKIEGSNVLRIVN